MFGRYILYERLKANMIKKKLQTKNNTLLEFVLYLLQIILHIKINITEINNIRINSV